MSALSQPTCVDCGRSIEPHVAAFGSSHCASCRDGGGKAPTISVTTTVQTRARRQIDNTPVLIWALASALFMLIGAFGPWAKVLGIVSINGTDADHHGWIVIACALLGALLLVATRTSRAAGTWAVLAGLASAALTIRDHHRISSVISKGGPIAQAFIGIGWGLDLAMVASVSFILSGLVWFVRDF